MKYSIGTINWFVLIITRPSNTVESLSFTVISGFRGSVIPTVNDPPPPPPYKLPPPPPPPPFPYPPLVFSSEFVLIAVFGAVPLTPNSI